MFAVNKVRLETNGGTPRSTRPWHSIEKFQRHFSTSNLSATEHRQTKKV